MKAGVRAPRVSVARDVYFSPATDEGCIVLNLERGSVLSLNSTGALLFSKLAETRCGLTRGEFVEIVKSEFADVETTRIEKAVDDLLARLEQTGTIKTEQKVAASRRRDMRAEFARRLPVGVEHLLRPLLQAKAYTIAALVLLFTNEAVRKLGGFRSIHHAVERWDVTIQPQIDDATLANACSAVNRACTWHPKRSLCLQRASVLVCLLRSLGFPAQMVIGVHKMPFYGHAWAEVEGRVVNDHANAQKFFHVLNRC
jgi:Transglutaminase-like superfamily/Coenzyme PQQ synthesis protein D (PqqD)